MRLNSATRLLPVLLTALTVLSIPAAAQETSVVTTDRFYVLGEVTTPGDFELKPDTTVKKAVETAGGLTPIADREGAVLIRGEERTSLDIGAIMTRKKPDMPLESGDTVLVKPGTYRVEGRVKSPGTFELKRDLTPQQALDQAGGLDEGADPKGVYLERGQRFIPLDLTTTSDKSARRVTVRPGDVLTVSELTVTVTGEVQRPGMYTLIPGQTDKVKDAIAAAGGPTKKANLKKIQLTYSEGDSAKTKLVNTSQPADDTVLHAGDNIYVPNANQKRRFGLNDLYQAIMIGATLIGIFR